MKKIILFLILFVCVSYASIIAMQEEINQGGIFLIKGKNFIEINSSSLIYAREIILLNPQIQSISYTEGNTSVGYLNAFGGIGRNFLVVPGNYEINSLKEGNLELPKK
ncbi:MAG: hypothetical protein ACP5OG_05580 [Candidatus Nanoarchaeia archaeon]